MAELSPMMKQYFKIKEENKDSILFFRLGDFYEMFFDDAKLASKELEPRYVCLAAVVGNAAHGRAFLLPAVPAC